MDLAVEAERLRLDALAVAVCGALESAGISHVLLKGPSTANWLYSPPRRYRDVDVLLPVSTLDLAVKCLSRAGIAFASAGSAGEEAEHSLLMISAEGFEVDLHMSLPTMPVQGDAVFSVLSPHIVSLDLGVGSVPVLDESARCLVLALHALNSGRGSGNPIEDLVRARAIASPSSWNEASSLASSLGVEDLFWAGVALVEPDVVPPGAASARARLFTSGAPASAFGLQRLSEVGWTHLPVALLREIFPSPGFMRRAEPGRAVSPSALLRAYVRRWGRILRELPAAVRAWDSARRGL